MLLVVYNCTQIMLIEIFNEEGGVTSGQLLSLASWRLSNSDMVWQASDRGKTNGGIYPDQDSKVTNESADKP